MLEESMRTGASAAQLLFDQPLYDYLGDHLEEALLFDRAMESLNRMSAPAILQAYDFSQFTSFVDVGGGIGTFLSLLLEKQPQMQCTLFERPETLENALKSISPAIRLVAGDFFQGTQE
jgi:hypothetical protein